MLATTCIPCAIQSTWSRGGEPLPLPFKCIVDVNNVEEVPVVVVERHRKHGIVIPHWVFDSF